MEVLFVFGWLVAGVLGTGLWWCDKVLFISRLYGRQRQWCPSPAGIFMMTLGVASGLFMMVMSVIWVLSCGEILKGTWWTESVCKWWTRPICRRD